MDVGAGSDVVYVSVAGVGGWVEWLGGSSGCGITSDGTVVLVESNGGDDGDLVGASDLGAAALLLLDDVGLVRDLLPEEQILVEGHRLDLLPRGFGREGQDAHVV